MEPIAFLPYPHLSTLVVHVFNNIPYVWVGGLGAQLHSRELFCPRPGTERYITIDGKEQLIRVFGSNKNGLLWDLSWSMYGIRTAEDLVAMKKVLKGLY